MKRFFQGLGVFSFSFVLYLALVGLLLGTPATHHLTRRESIKGWLSESGFYNNLRPALKRLAANQFGGPEEEPGQEVDMVRLDQAIDELATPQFVQANVERALDGTYDWLEGETPEPVFELKLGEQKPVLVAMLAELKLQDLESSPPCPPGVVPEGFESESLQDIECLPEEIPLEEVRGNLRQAVEKSLGLEEGDTVSSQQLLSFLGNGIPEAEPKEPLPQSVTMAPKVFSLIKLSPWFWTALALLSILGLRLLFGGWIKTGQRVAALMLGAGILAAITTFVMTMISDIGLKEASYASSRWREVFDLLIPLAKTALSDINGLVYILSGIAVVIGIGIKAAIAVHTRRHRVPTLTETTKF